MGIITSQAITIVDEAPTDPPEVGGFMFARLADSFIFYHWDSIEEEWVTSIPEPVKDFHRMRFLVSQESTDNPEVIILENTVDTVTFQRTDVGKYRIVSDEKFVDDKTNFESPRLFYIDEDKYVKIYKTSGEIYLYIDTYSGGVLGDDVLNKFYLDIVIYN